MGWSMETMAPPMSLGCRWVARMSGRSLAQTRRTPRRSKRASSRLKSSVCRISMYPLSPRRSISRPAAVPGRVGETISTNWSPSMNTALSRPNSATPGSR